MKIRLAKNGTGPEYETALFPSVSLFDLLVFTSVRPASW